MHGSLERFKIVKWIFHPIISLQGRHLELRWKRARCDLCYEGRVSAMYQVVKCWCLSFHGIHHKIHHILHCLHLNLPSCIASFWFATWCIYSSSSLTRCVALSLIFLTTIIPWLVIVAALLVVVDTVFCSLSICIPNPKKSKNISFSSQGCENIQNDMAQPI